MVLEQKVYAMIHSFFGTQWCCGGLVASSRINLGDSGFLVSFFIHSYMVKLNQMNPNSCWKQNWLLNCKVVHIVYFYFFFILQS